MTRKGTKPGAAAAQRQPGPSNPPSNAGSNANSFANREREALDALDQPIEMPPKGSQDTVKLTSQTWQPPPPKKPAAPTQQPPPQPRQAKPQQVPQRGQQAPQRGQQAPQRAASQRAPQHAHTAPAAAPAGKLQPQSWKGAQETVKVEAMTWQEPSQEEEDAVTDIRDAPELDGVVTGESSPEVAGEIGSTDDQPVRIISVPPSKLPGMPEAARPPADAVADLAPMPRHPTPPPANQPIASRPPQPTGSRGMTTDRAPVAPMPVAVRPGAAPARPAAPTPTPATTPAPAHARQATPTPLPDKLAPPNTFGEATPQPRAVRRVDPTMILRIQRGPTRAIIVTAVIAACLGLAAGYVIWGIDRSSGEAETQAKPASAANETVDTKSIVDTEKAAAAMKSSAAVEAPSCELSVVSSPKGAAVSLNKKKLGSTPLQVKIPCEKADVTVRKRNYEAVTSNVDPSAAKKMALDVKLERPMFVVNVKSTPAGAEIHLDGKQIGQTPMRVEVAGYTKTPLVLKRKGFRPTTTSITAKKKSSTQTFRLKRKKR